MAPVVDSGEYNLRIAGINQAKPDAFDANTVDSQEDFRGAFMSKGDFRINPRWTFGWDVLLQTDKNFAYLSSGTWSLMGIENDEPIINDISRRYSFTNEGGAFGRINIMKNIMGLWLIQESRRQWKREGREYTFDEMSDAALKSEPFRSIINPDDPSFNAAGDLPARIREYCRSTGQPEPETMGAVVRCIFESLALRYRWTAEKLEELCDRKFGTINIVGGGTKDELLCRFTANGTGRRVSAGPVEATAIGNILMQAYAAGEISGAREGRSIVRASFENIIYEPDMSQKDGWQSAYERFCKLIG